MLRASGVCVCVESVIFIRLHPTRIGHGSCWLFPLIYLPSSCPHPAIFCKRAPGSRPGFSSQRATHESCNWRPIATRRVEMTGLLN